MYPASFEYLAPTTLDEVSIAGTRETVEREGRMYCFCGAGWRSRFEADPARYLAAA